MTTTPAAPTDKAQAQDDGRPTFSLLDPDSGIRYYPKLVKTPEGNWVLQNPEQWEPLMRRQNSARQQSEGGPSSSTKPA